MCGRYYRTADKSALQTGAAATYASAYDNSSAFHSAHRAPPARSSPCAGDLSAIEPKAPAPPLPHTSPVRIPSNGALFGANRCTNAAVSSPRTVISNGCSLKVFPTASPSSIPKCSLLLVYGTLGRTLRTVSGLRASPSALPTATRFLVDFNDNYNDEEDPRMPVILQPNDYDYWLTVTKSTNPAQTYWCPTMRIERLLGQPIPRWAISQQPRPRRPAPLTGNAAGSPRVANAFQMTSVTGPVFLLVMKSQKKVGERQP